MNSWFKPFSKFACRSHFCRQKTGRADCLVLGPRRPPATTRGECGERARCRRATPRLDAAPEVGPSAKAVASANAKRAAFHADLASGQWGALEKARGCRAGSPGSLRRAGDPRGRKALPAPARSGTRPARFLLGFRALLEAQGGRTVSVAWRVDPATLTQSGGGACMRTPSRSCPSLATAARTWRRLSPSLPSVKICAARQVAGLFAVRDAGDVDLYKLLLRETAGPPRCRTPTPPARRRATARAFPRTRRARWSPSRSGEATARPRWERGGTCARSSSSPSSPRWRRRRDGDLAACEMFFFLSCFRS